MKIRRNWPIKTNPENHLAEGHWATPTDRNAKDKVLCLRTVRPAYVTL